MVPSTVLDKSDRLQQPRAPSRTWLAICWLGRILWFRLPQTSARASTELAESHLRTVRLGAELVSLVFAVCLAIFLTKIVVAGNELDKAVMPPQIYTDDRLGSLARIAACCAEDVAVGLACLLVAGVALCFATSRRWRGILRTLLYGSSVAALFLMGINAHIFQTNRKFLTLLELQLAGAASLNMNPSGGLNMERSVAESITPALWLTLVLLPLGTIAVHLWSIWAFPRFWQRAAHGLCRPVLLLTLIVGLALFGRQVQASTWFDTPRHFAHNPHWLLAYSFFEPRRSFELGEVKTVELADFEPGNPRLSKLPLAKRPTNIVLIVLESVGAQYLDLYGAPWPVTPNLRRLEAKGIVFDNHYATVNFSIAAALPLFGSIHNDTCTFSTVVAFPDYPVPFASSWLKKQGYKTYFLGSGGHSGWENYRNMTPAYVSRGQFDVARDEKHPFWRQNPNPVKFWKYEYDDRATFVDAKRVLHDARGGKFFLVIWNYGTHYPYYPEDKTTTFDESSFPPLARTNAERRELMTKYLRSIRDVDAMIGDFYTELEKLGLAEDTLVVVTGDHGEAWGQHGNSFHGYSLYEEEVRVPLMMIYPPLAARGTRDKVVGSHIDIWPTIMDICGLPCDPRWQGRSLFGGTPKEERRAYFYGINQMWGLRQGKFKYIFDGRTETDLLFDLDADPGETINLAREHPQLCDQFRRRLQVWANYQTCLTRDCLGQ